MNLANLAERNIIVTLEGDQLRVRGDIDDDVVAVIREHRAALIAELRWPYATAADEPRCNSCVHWKCTRATWPKTGERIGDCLRNGFDALELDNCKRHQSEGGDGEA